MTMGQHGRATPADRLQALAAQPVFAPMLGIWGAALAGLSIMVLPARLFASASQNTGPALLGNLGQPICAVLGALVLGGALFLIANRMHLQARPGAEPLASTAQVARGVDTIDPQRDLGSVCLDEPVGDVPFAAETLHNRAAGPSATTATPQTPPLPGADRPLPRALDLAEFALLPGRNGAWIEDQPAQADADAAPPAAAFAGQPLRLAPELASRPTAKAFARTAPTHPSAAALEQLRATPTHELSIVQMVERFAAALHDHREAAPGTAAATRNIAAREAALAQALRALAALGGEPALPHAADQNEPLRDALSRLQGARGAA